MLDEFVNAGFIAFCLLIFYSVNICNLQRAKREKTKNELQSQTQSHQQVKPPLGFGLLLAGVGTILFWLESIFYPVLVFTGFSSLLKVYPLQFSFPNDTAIQLLGIALTATGYFLFIWSVITRGRHATSWDMPANHKLVTWGPYRYVRHPSYLAYFLLFFGLPLMLLNMLALPCLFAIPGYFKLVEKEEKLLIKRFGDEYLDYQKRTGRFLPCIFRKKRKGFLSLLLRR